MRIARHLALSLLLLRPALSPAQGADTAAVQRRAAELARVVDRSSSWSHMTRGINACTISALRAKVDDRDVPALEAMLAMRQPRHRQAAGYVLSLMGSSGAAALRNNAKRLGDAEVERLIEGAPATAKALRESAGDPHCKR